MTELKVNRMQRDTRNPALRRFRLVVLSVADHRVTGCRELHPDLILQPRHQRHAHQ